VATAVLSDSNPSVTDQNTDTDELHLVSLWLVMSQWRQVCRIA